MGKLRDLWAGDGERAVNAPQPVHITRGWDVRPEALPLKPLAPRKRRYAHVRPNNRDAVALPHPGQSYNPQYDDHQAALRVAVRKLRRKKRADEKFVAMMTRGRDTPVTWSSDADKAWEEEVQERPQTTKKKEKAGTAATVKNQKKAEKKNKKRKKVTKASLIKAAKNAFPHRRHPKREVVVKEADRLDEIIVGHAEQQSKRDSARERRRALKREGLQVKCFGRYYHTPLVLDVAPTEKLVGSLRHLNGGHIHAVVDRINSLEERNLIPARMRHTYNKRKVLKPKGEVRLKRETFGVLPETSF